MLNDQDGRRWEIQRRFSLEWEKAEEQRISVVKESPPSDKGTGLPEKGCKEREAGQWPERYMEKPGK